MESILEAKETDVTRSTREVRAMAACVTVESNPYRPCKSSGTHFP